MFGGVAHASTNNVFAKLKDSTKDKLIVMGCPPHILNNCLQHGMDTSDLDIQSAVLNHFSVYTVRTETLKEFHNFVYIECKQMLYHCEAR
jgi:hypothetical protein